MGGPSQQVTNTVLVAPGEGRQVYSSVALAWLVENLEVGVDDVLSSVVGPSILRINPEAYASSSSTAFEDVDISTAISSAISSMAPGITPYGYKTSRPHSVFFARLLNGGANTLLYRFGSRLYRFNGNVRDGSDDVILSGLSSANNPDYPDQYVVLNDKIVFTNGIDRAKVISADGNVTDLGFSMRASTPSVSSPTQPDYDTEPLFYPNSRGYSYQGRIGTPGDVLLGREGALLAGSWYYYFQYEDIHGNLSEFSVPSEAAVIRSNQASPYKSFRNRGTVGDPDYVIKDGRYSAGGETTEPVQLDRIEAPEGSEIDDLTRRFLVRATGDAPEHTAAIRIFRTPDTLHADPTPRYVTRVPGSKQFVYDDNNADSDLGLTWDEPVSVPVFRVACAHQGRLIIANTPGDPGILRRSEPGFPGTFLKDDFIFPDSSGAEITAVASHQGNLLAFTDSAVYAIGDDFRIPQPLLRGIGCIAPRSIAALKDGTLMWLSRDGFYSMSPTGEITRSGASLDRVFRDDINHSRMHLAASAIDSKTGEYRCVLAPAGKRDNLLMFCFDGKFWRRQTLGIHIADMCTATDFTRNTFAIGFDPREQDVAVTKVDPQFSRLPLPEKVDFNRLFVLNRQTTDYFGPPRRIRYRSSWIRADEFGLLPTNVRSFFVGLMDSWVGNATVRFYRNDSWDPYVEVNDLLLHGPDDESDVIKDSAATAVVGESKVHNSRIFWRKVPVDLQNATSWAFEIDIVGSPAPSPPAPGDWLWKQDAAAWVELTREDKKAGSEKYYEVSQNSESYELGRMRIAAFSFEMSLASSGSARGRVPFRQDK